MLEANHMIRSDVKSSYLFRPPTSAFYICTFRSLGCISGGLYCIDKYLDVTCWIHGRSANQAKALSSYYRRLIAHICVGDRTPWCV